VNDCKFSGIYALSSKGTELFTNFVIESSVSKSALNILLYFLVFSSHSDLFLSVILMISQSVFITPELRNCINVDSKADAYVEIIPLCQKLSSSIKYFLFPVLFCDP
jgi:hypothetical protein